MNKATVDENKLNEKPTKNFISKSKKAKVILDILGKGELDESGNGFLDELYGLASENPSPSDEELSAILGSLTKSLSKELDLNGKVDAKNSLLKSALETAATRHYLDKVTVNPVDRHYRKFDQHSFVEDKKYHIAMQHPAVIFKSLVDAAESQQQSQLKKLSGTTARAVQLLLQEHGTS